MTYKMGNKSKFTSPAEVMEEILLCVQRTFIYCTHEECQGNYDDLICCYTLRIHRRGGIDVNTRIVC